MDEPSDPDEPLIETLMGVVVVVLEGTLDLAIRSNPDRHAKALAVRCEALQHLTAAILLLAADEPERS